MVRAQYNPDIFRLGDIQKLLADLEAVLEAAMYDPALQISKLGVACL